MKSSRSLSSAFLATLVLTFQACHGQHKSDAALNDESFSEYYDDDLSIYDDFLEGLDSQIAAESQARPIRQAPPPSQFQQLVNGQPLVPANGGFQTGKLVPQSGWLPVSVHQYNNNNPRPLNSVPSPTFATTTSRKIVDNPLSIIQGVKKSNAPPITVFPNDTIVIHYESVAFPPNNPDIQNGPRPERATIPKTIEARFETLRKSCSGIDVDSFVVDLLRSPSQVRFAMIKNILAQRHGLKNQQNPNNLRTPKAVNRPPPQAQVNPKPAIQQQSQKVPPQINQPQQVKSVSVKQQSVQGSGAKAPPPKAFIQQQFSNFPAFQKKIEQKINSNPRATAPPIQTGEIFTKIPQHNINNNSNQQFKQPPRTQPPRTQPPRTQPPRTQPPRTQPPRTQPPRTQPPRTQPPRTQPPRTQPPRTQPRRTQPPATQPPRAQPRRTQPPATQPPRAQPPRSQPSRINGPASQSSRNSKQIRTQASRTQNNQGVKKSQASFVPQQVGQGSNSGKNKSFPIEKFLQRYPEVRRVSSRFGENQVGAVGQVPTKPGSQDGQRQKQSQNGGRKQQQRPTRPQKNQRKKNRKPARKQGNKRNKQQSNVQQKQKNREQTLKQLQNFASQDVSGFHDVPKIQSNQPAPSKPKPPTTTRPPATTRQPKKIRNEQQAVTTTSSDSKDFEDDAELSSDEYSYLYYQDYYEELVPEHHRFNRLQTTTAAPKQPAQVQGFSFVQKQPADKSNNRHQNNKKNKNFPNFPPSVNKPPILNTRQPVQVKKQVGQPAAPSAPVLPSTQDGPFGYTDKGKFFSDAIIPEFPESIEIIYQGFVWAMKVRYPNVGDVMHGGVHTILKDKVKRETVSLKGDYIVRVTGRASPYNINRLTFYTANGKQFGPWGDRRSEESTDFDVSAPEGQALAFFSGTIDFGVPLRSISMHWRPR